MGTKLTIGRCVMVSLCDILYTNLTGLRDAQIVGRTFLGLSVKVICTQNVYWGVLSGTTPIRRYRRQD